MLAWQVPSAADAMKAAQTADSLKAAKAAAEAFHEVLTPAIVKNPLPGFVGRIFQWLFNLPPWFQITAVVVGALVGTAIIVMLWSKRAQVTAWFRRQSHGYKIGLVGASAVMVIGAGGAGYAGNYYTVHNNDFCIGCHVMGTAWTAFQVSEHKKLECHECHRQSKFASMKQLYYWVAERPQKIPLHAKVPTVVCAECHVQSPADSTWKRITASAGHRLHLNSDSASLKHVECVTCHGTEVHRFKSVDKTCGQSNCHAAKDTKIVLGKMAGQTAQHCTGCHTFSRPVAENISMDSTRKFLIATGSPESCFGCHVMKEKLRSFSPEKDIGHKGVCGSCHNPHKQTQPKDAFQSCANAGCHDNLAAKSAFHSKSSVHKVADCSQCHKAHDWQPIGRECIDCHKGVFNSKPQSVPRPPAGKNGDGLSGGVSTRRDARTSRLQAMVRAKSNRAGVRLTFAARQVGSQPQPRTATAKPATRKDSAQFSHQIHKVLACAGCHDQKAAPGALKIRSTNDCAACHHSPERSVSCEGCHSTREHHERAFPKNVSMRIANKAPQQRELPFVHKNHRDLECKTCHTSGTRLGVTRNCLSCHTEHHNAERACSTCHAPAKTVHQRSAHDGCAGSGCHTNTQVLALGPTRATCLTCHAEQVNHKPKRECAECHAVTWSTAVSKPG